MIYKIWIFDLYYHNCKVRQKIKDEYCIIALDPERDSPVSMAGRIPTWTSFSDLFSHFSSSLPSSQSLSLLQINSFWKFYIGTVQKGHRHFERLESESGFAGQGWPFWAGVRRRTMKDDGRRIFLESVRLNDGSLTKSVPSALVRMQVRKTIWILFLVDAAFSDIIFDSWFAFEIEMRIATLITRHQVYCIAIAIISIISYVVTKIKILVTIYLNNCIPLLSSHPYSTFSKKEPRSQNTFWRYTWCQNICFEILAWTDEQRFLYMFLWSESTSKESSLDIYFVTEPIVWIDFSIRKSFMRFFTVNDIVFLFRQFSLHQTE